MSICRYARHLSNQICLNAIFLMARINLSAHHILFRNTPLSDTLSHGERSRRQPCFCDQLTFYHKIVESTSRSRSTFAFGTPSLPSVPLQCTREGSHLHPERNKEALASIHEVSEYNSCDEHNLKKPSHHARTSIAGLGFGDSAGVAMSYRETMEPGRVRMHEQSKDGHINSKSSSPSIAPPLYHPSYKTIAAGAIVASTHWRLYLRDISNSQITWLFLYFTLNLGLTFLNKYILDQFPYPYTVTALHTACGAVGGALLRKLGCYTPSKLGVKENIALFTFSSLYTINIAVSNCSLRLVSIPVTKFHSLLFPYILT
jgi:hypothetical protein